MGYALTAAFSSGALFFYISSSSFVFQDIYGLTSTQYSLVFAANAVGLMAVGWLNANLVRRHDPAVLLPLGRRQGVVGIVRAVHRALARPRAACGAARADVHRAQPAVHRPERDRSRAEPLRAGGGHGLGVARRPAVRGRSHRFTARERRRRGDRSSRWRSGCSSWRCSRSVPARRWCRHDACASVVTSRTSRIPTTSATFASAAEEIGFDHIGFSEHVASSRLTEYPALFSYDDPWHESFTMLAFLAAVTTTIELSSAMALITLRRSGVGGQAGRRGRPAVAGPAATRRERRLEPRGATCARRRSGDTRSSHRRDGAAAPSLVDRGRRHPPR